MEQEIQDNSPFATPQASLEQPQIQEYDTSSSPFSPKGRFGRIDYLAYTLMLGFASMLVSSAMGVIIASTATSTESVGVPGMINLVITLPLLAIGLMFMIRRLHDLNWSGWLAITYIIPLVNFIIFLILIFMPGTPTANKYGPPRKPPTRGRIILALILPTIFFIGILAAIAIPAYQNYLLRAQGM